jgi:N-alpha-acetyltransferase 40
MQILEHLGTSFNLSKSMLTVFTSNTSALSFYTKLGYLFRPPAAKGRYTIDPTSPPARILRSNHTILPDYQILSKPLTTPE